eukprot:11843474-Ditylum_brightwellii.AAC.1
MFIWNHTSDQNMLLFTLDMASKKTELGCPLTPSAPPGTQVMVDTRSASLYLSPKNDVLLTAIPQVLQVDHVAVFCLGMVAASGGGGFPLLFEQYHQQNQGQG